MNVVFRDDELVAILDAGSLGSVSAPVLSSVDDVKERGRRRQRTPRLHLNGEKSQDDGGVDAKGTYGSVDSSYSAACAVNADSKVDIVAPVIGDVSTVSVREGKNELGAGGRCVDDSGHQLRDVHIAEARSSAGICRSRRECCVVGRAISFGRRQHWSHPS